MEYPPRIRSFILCTAWLVAVLLAASSTSGFGQSPPASFSRTVATASESVTVDFVAHPIRSANFGVLVQDAAGSFNAYTPRESRIYFGTIASHPGAIAAGLLKPDGTLLCRISFETGVEWSSTGSGVASIRGSTNWEPAWPTTETGAGGAGSTVRAAEVGIDATYQQFVTTGSDVDATVEMAEFSVMASNLSYLRDAALLHQIGKVVIRASSAADPYEPLGGDLGQLLPELRTQWTSVIPVGTTHDLALVARPGAGGGLAYVGVIGTASRYSANGTDSNGDFSVIWRHEAGHNWGSSHYEGGGKPEGPTIMSDNALSRFSSSELAKIINHRNTKTGILDTLGLYPFPLPPRANMDRAVFLNTNPVKIDVLANDSDSNGDALTLLSFPASSAKGGTLARSIGTGPGERDQILYTPAPGFTTGTDSFSYRIQDATGRTGTGYVVVGPVGESLLPVDRWKLDEDSYAGSRAMNAARSSSYGFHTTGVLTGKPGANASTGLSAYFTGNGGHTWLAKPNYNTATLTITTWVKRDGTQNPWAPFVFTRDGTSVAGFGFGTAHELRYTWNNAGTDFTPSPALTVPDGEWCLAAMAVSPTGVTLHLRTAAGLQSATHTTAITAEAFDGAMYLGRDPLDETRYFKGWFDDVRVYDQTLTAAHIESLYQQALHPPELHLSQPLEGSSIQPLNATFGAEVSDGGYLVKSIDFLDHGTVVGNSSSEPYQFTVAALNPGWHLVTARANFGDWGYSTDSVPVNVTALQPPLPEVTVTTSGVPSRSGPVAADFVITRSHPIGGLTVPFTISGSAVSGTDYQSLSTSAYIPAGELSRTVTLTPIAAPPGAVKTVTLTATPTASFVVGNPSAATLTIDDHYASIANGTWNTGATWSSGLAAPGSGTQGTGNDYAVAHVVTSNNTGSNSQALIARSLKIQNGGTLDLARLHSTVNQDVFYNLPPVALEGGGAIRFRASLGSSTHNVLAAITNSGNSFLRINGGNYVNSANLTGAISGSGSIAVVSESSAGVSVGDVRQISVNSANNTFSGDWSVVHQASGDDFAALRAGAIKALGTGTVTVGTRSRLINDVSGGLNSIAGVVMNGATSTLQLNQPWVNPAASLALAGGSPVVVLGSGTSTIGNLSGTVGTISGTTGTSTLKVEQTSDSTFAGSLGTSLRFNKSGPATLRLTGAIDPSLRPTISAGGLGFGASAVSVNALTQTGGTLLLPLGSTAPLTIALGYTCTGGGISVSSDSVPAIGVSYPLVAYRGALSGHPAFTFDGPLPSGIIPIVNYGSGTNSRISVTFGTDPYPAWIANYGLIGDDALPNADPDGDGVANREEMVLGFDPKDPSSRLRLTVAGADDTTITLRLNRVVTAGTFTLESSATLQVPWSSSPITVPADANDFEFQAPRSGSTQFFRAVFQTP